MTEKPRRGRAATTETAGGDGGRDLDAIADELYGLRPDAFASTRDAEVKQARAAGRAALARELAQLRRPTQSAWLVNLLWRDQREVMEQLFQLGDELGRAQAQASGTDLRTLTAQRRDLEAALLRRANVLAGSAGVRVTDAMAREAQDTLAAAVAQPEVANEVRTGRLVKPTAYAGFGPLVVSAPPSPAKRGADALPAETPGAEATVGDAPAGPSPPSKSDIVDLRAAQRARERRAAREAAEQRLWEARQALETASSELASGKDVADEAQRQSAALRQQLATLRAQLDEVEEQVAAAERAADAAARRRDQADQAHKAALQTLRRAEQELEEATSD